MSLNSSVLPQEERIQQKVVASLYPFTPPPNTIPKHCTMEMKDTHPELLTKYLYSFIYVWLSAQNRKDTSFWMYPTGVSRHAIFGYIWKKKKWTHVCFRHSLIERFF